MGGQEGEVGAVLVGQRVGLVGPDLGGGVDAGDRAPPDPPGDRIRVVEPAPVGQFLLRAAVLGRVDRMQVDLTSGGVRECQHGRQQVPLAEAAKAHRLIESGRTVGKIVLTV